MINGLENGKYNYTIDIKRPEQEYISYFEKEIITGLIPTKQPLIVAAMKEVIEFKMELFNDIGKASLYK